MGKLSPENNLGQIIKGLKCTLGSMDFLLQDTPCSVASNLAISLCFCVNQALTPEKGFFRWETIYKTH